MTSRVSLVIVSHSRQLAQGVRELAGQMAPLVHIGTAAGAPDGGLGTSFDLVAQSLTEALAASHGRGVVAIADMGSASMTVESVLEFVADSVLYRLPDGPMVEGAVAAAVAAEQGEDLEAVAAAVVEAAGMWSASPTMAPSPEAGEEDPGSPIVRGNARVGDIAGIHARAAAALARLVAGYDAEIRINGVDASSVLEVMTLAIPNGTLVSLEAAGPEAQRAIDELAPAIVAGLDQL